MNESESNLSPKAEQIRDVFAYYGSAMYLSQNIERSLSLILALNGGSPGMTAWDFDARLADNYQCTFGDLVSKFLQSSLASPSGLSDRLRLANTRRNELAHQYFWNHSIQFASSHGQLEMIAELQQIRADFESLDDDLAILQEAAIKNHVDDLEGFKSRVKTVFEGFLLESGSPHNPERVPSNIDIVDAEEWRSDPNKPGNLVLISNEGRYLNSWRKRNLLWTYINPARYDKTSTHV